MKLSHLLLTLVLSALVAFATASYLARSSHGGGAPSAPAVTAFDRILKTNTLRCGYAVATPWFMMDPVTSKPSGVDADVVAALAAKIGVKVEWTEETGWGTAEQGLITGRYDMLCGSVCIDPRRDRAANYSTPFLHLPLMAVVRANDTRFDNPATAFELLNKPDIKVGVKSGHVFEFVANEQFPQAQKVYANDISDDTEFLEMIKDHKIDFSFPGQSTVDLYNAKNPDAQLKSVGVVRFCDGAFMIPLGDERLKHMVDDAVMELSSSGQLRAILNRWVKPDDPLYARAPAKPYGDR